VPTRPALQPIGKKRVGTAHDRPRKVKGRAIAFAHPTIHHARFSAKRTHRAENVQYFNNMPPRSPPHKTGGGPAVVPPGPLAYQPTCKPGSVGRNGDALRVTAIPLGRRLPGASSNLPGRPDPDIDPDAACAAPRRPYSVLLPVGFAVPPTLPPTRCALTAPFHPYRG